MSVRPEIFTRPGIMFAITPCSLVLACPIVTFDRFRADWAIDWRVYASFCLVNEAHY